MERHKVLLGTEEVLLSNSMIVLANNKTTYQTDRRVHRVGEAVSVLPSLVLCYRPWLSKSLLPFFFLLFDKNEKFALSLSTVNRLPLPNRNLNNPKVSDVVTNCVFELNSGSRFCSETRLLTSCFVALDTLTLIS